MTSAAIPVSVCIPVKNEALNLPACLAALEVFTEVVVVDSGSTDETVAIAEAHGATVLQFQWNGRFPKKRNWALQNHDFKHPWVLFLDADERMNLAFVEELKQILPSTSHVGFWISFTNWFLGRPLKHGDVMRKLALFRRDAGEYERFPEDSWSSLDMEVHEHPVFAGTVGSFQTRLQHHDFRDMNSYVARHKEYSTWEARRFLWLRSASPAAWDQLNSRQRFKYRHLNKWWFSYLYWFIAFILKQGFLDGAAGFALAAMKRRYFAEIRSKIRESASQTASLPVP